MEKKKWKQWLYWFSLALAIVVVYKTLDSFTQIVNSVKEALHILMPFIVAILLAYIFYIPSRKLEGMYKKISTKWIQNHARTISVLSVYAITIVIVAVIFKFVLPSISSSVKELFNNLPAYYTSAIEHINNLPEESVLNKIDMKSITNNLQNIDIAKIIPVENITGFAVEGVKGATNFLFNIFVAIIISIYLLLERTEILEFIKKLTGAIFKKKTNKRLGSYFRKTNEIFYKFVASQVLDAIIIGTILSIALYIMNVKYGILLGLMIGLLNVIPYFGAIIGVVIAIIITIFTGGFTQALIMTIVVVILQQIDANIINPKIVGNSLKLSPILIILAVTIGGAYFGILGMFLAVPVVAILKILILDYIEYKNMSNKKAGKKKLKMEGKDEH